MDGDGLGDFIRWRAAVFVQATRMVSKPAGHSMMSVGTL